MPPVLYLRAMGAREGIWHHDQAPIRRARVCGNDGFELGRVVNRCGARLHCEERGGGFEGVQLIFGVWRRYRVEQDGPLDARRNLLEQLQPLAGHRRLHIRKASDVAARPRKARDEAAADRIGKSRENDRDGARLLQQSRRVGRAMRKNQVGLQRDEFLGELGSRLGVVGCRPANVDLDIAALRPPELRSPSRNAATRPCPSGRSRDTPSARRCVASARAAERAPRAA